MLTPQQKAQLRSEPLSNRRNKLTRAKQLAGVTQVEIAARTGFTQPFISAIELGKYGRNGLGLETTRTLARYFGIDIEDLFPAREEVAS